LQNMLHKILYSFYYLQISLGKLSHIRESFDPRFNYNLINLILLPHKDVKMKLQKH